MKTPTNQTAFVSAPDKANSNTGKFTGTDNPRQLRAIDALLRRPIPREHLDRAAGCSNGPALVQDLRSLGLDVDCERVPDLDRDGLPIRRGVYRLSATDRTRIKSWLAIRSRAKVGAGNTALLFGEAK